LINKYPCFNSNYSKLNLHLSFVTVCILIVCGLTACTSRAIYLDKNFNPPVFFGQHVVQSGDTLYSIAWRYGREMKELAQANQITPPYVIKLGQKINLESDKINRNNNLNLSGSGSNNKNNVTERKEKIQNGKNVTKNKNSKKFKNIKWQWPHLGPILAKYSVSTSRTSRSVERANTKNALNKGLDISGQLGSSVLAAADGEVVYAGSGLLGYGNLVIINHNEIYLSAYAHNQQILVKEGQNIKRGRKIAEMGSSDSKQVMLHFEIRRDGQPVDPMKYLPKKRKQPK
jgi:lipoprotein NlpD